MQDEDEIQDILN